MEHMQQVIPSTISQDKWKPIAIVSIIAFALSAGLAIFFFIQNNSKQSQIDSLISTCDNKISESCGDVALDTPITSDDVPNKTADYLVVQKWGIKIRMRDADKISLHTNFSMLEDPAQDVESGAYYDSLISYTINDGVLFDNRCDAGGLGGVIIRLINTGGLTNYRIVGDYAFAHVASPGIPCEFNTQDSALQVRIFKDFTTSNMEQIIPFVTK